MSLLHLRPSPPRAFRLRRLIAAVVAIVWLSPLGVRAQASHAPSQGTPPSPRPLVAVEASADAQQPEGSPGGQRAKVPAKAGAAAASASAATGEPPTPDPRAARRLTTARRIRALLAGTLDVGVDAPDLFDLAVDLGDETAIRVEVERLRAITAHPTPLDPPRGALDAGLDSGAGGSAARGTPPAAPSPKGAAAPASNAGAAGAAVSTRTDAAPEPEVAPELWEAQLALDRARLAFFSLPVKKRQSIVDQHVERQKANAQAKRQRELTDAEKAANEAGEQRQEALLAAQKARTEAARLIAEERARLLGVIKGQAEYEARLVKRELTLAAEGEQVLKLRREVREALDAADRTAAALAAPRADALYDLLRSNLHEARRRLASVTTLVSNGSSGVPKPGEDRLSGLPPESAPASAVQLRYRAEKGAVELSQQEREVALREAEQLYRNVQLLNADRLALLPHLSATKRGAVTGFGTAGLGQATSEAQQVALVVRYHLAATLHWLAALIDTRSARGSAALDAILLGLRALVPLIVFIGWRRRADRSLAALREVVAPSRARSLRQSHAPPWRLRLVNLAVRVHSPLEWLLLVFLVGWILPQRVSSLLEFQVPATILAWILGGSLVVLVIDFFAGEDEERRHRRSQLQTAHLRLRSLRLVGRVVVAFGLILSLTSQLVGEGTIYGWVLQLCWFAGIPVVLALVRWWRHVIFVRLEARRKKRAFEHWIVNNQEGWKSFVAVLVGGALLAAQGSYRWARVWFSTFDLTRRVLAYLFRREITKKADSSGHVLLAPLPAEAFARLSPETPSREYVASVADTQIAEVIRRIKAPGGGVFAIVGERGLGKSTMLTRIAREANHVRVLNCPFGGMERFAPEFLRAVGAPLDANLEEVASAYDEASRTESAIVIDDAHRLILPMIGGLRSFDRVLDIARRHSENAAWVFAFDDMIWRFFERIRGAQPLFDDVVRLQPWEEKAIVELLLERAQEAAVDPDFGHLVGRLPPDADEIDHREAQDRTESSYYRLIWDYAGGNPGVALHTWRALLGLDPRGLVSVKVFQAPSTELVERLPDTAVFVLRAVVQLECATASAIASATGISLTEVQDVLRFGSVKGYFRHDERGYHVSWTWFRVITRFLQRRHLLFAD